MKSRENITVALINGKQVKYDCAIKIKDKNEPDWIENFNFIGTGVVYSINGVKQNDNRGYKFYVKK